jgi:hypothetical protein
MGGRSAPVVKRLAGRQSVGRSRCSDSPRSFMYRGSGAGFRADRSTDWLSRGLTIYLSPPFFRTDRRRTRFAVCRGILGCRCVARIPRAGTGCLSVQVLQEFFVTVTAKVAEPLSVEEAADRVRELGRLDRVRSGGRRRSSRHRAEKAGRIELPGRDDRARRRRTGMRRAPEDLSDAQVVRSVRIRNPFAR